MPSTNVAHANARREDREAVHFRTVAIKPDGGSLPLLIVNISPNGLMARCDQPIEPGVGLTFRLPNLSPLRAEVRWSLGGRIGCEFAETIAMNSYFAILPRLRG